MHTNGAGGGQVLLGWAMDLPTALSAPWLEERLLRALRLAREDKKCMREAFGSGSAVSRASANPVKHPNVLPEGPASSSLQICGLIFALLISVASVKRWPKEQLLERMLRKTCLAAAWSLGQGSG